MEEIKFEEIKDLKIVNKIIICPSKIVLNRSLIFENCIIQAQLHSQNEDFKIHSTAFFFENTQNLNTVRLQGCDFKGHFQFTGTKGRLFINDSLIHKTKLDEDTSFMFQDAELMELQIGFLENIQNLQFRDCKFERVQIYGCEMNFFQIVGTVIKSLVFHSGNKIKIMSLEPGFENQTNFVNIPLSDIENISSYAEPTRNSLKILLNIFNRQYEKEKYAVTFNKIKELEFKDKEIGIIKYFIFTKWFYNFYSLYKIFFTFIIFIIFFSIIYFFSSKYSSYSYLSHISIKESVDFFTCLYFSLITMTTVGYGDIHPVGILRFIAGIQGLLGVMLTAGLGFVISRRYT